jgi:gliding motility-associated lipoprotein GldB
MQLKHIFKPIKTFSSLRPLVILPLLLWLFSCKKNTCETEVDTSDVSISFQLFRFDKALHEAKSTSEIAELVKQNPLFAKQFLLAAQFPPDTIVANLNALRNDKHIDTMYTDCQRIFGNLNGINQELTDAYKHIAYYYPGFNPPKAYSIVSGFGSDLYVSDSLLVIALESFLGDSGRYKPPLTPLYILNRMKPNYLVPSIMMMTSNKFNKLDVLDNSMIGEMIHWGKTYYFIKKMMPCVHDSVIIGYSGPDLNGCNNNLDKIYAYFVDRKLFFQTNHIEINRYIGERPKTVEVGNECPGRIGRYLGWKIVQAYMKQKKISLQELMQEKDAKRIFTESKFRPEV